MFSPPQTRLPTTSRNLFSHSETNLLEANVRGVLTEAATADVHSVLADDGLASTADTAGRGGGRKWERERVREGQQGKAARERRNKERAERAGV